MGELAQSNARVGIGSQPPHKASAAVRRGSYGSQQSLCSRRLAYGAPSWDGISTNTTPLFNRCQRVSGPVESVDYARIAT